MVGIQEETQQGVVGITIPDKKGEGVLTHQESLDILKDRMFCGICGWVGNRDQLLSDNRCPVCRIKIIVLKSY
jgi:predicted Zn-ribbon and HTH transcriptional regulator